MKVVINKCYGGFGLSEEAIQLYANLTGITIKTIEDKQCQSLGVFHHYLDGIEDDEHYFHVPGIKRNDPALVSVVEQLGDKVNTRYSELKIVDIPDDVEYFINEYDGIEWVAEKHRTWE